MRVPYPTRGRHSPHQRLHHRLRIILDRSQQRACRPRRLPPALVPVPQRADIDVEYARELLLAELRQRANLLHGDRIPMELTRWRTLAARNLAVLLHALGQSFEESLVHFCHASFNLRSLAFSFG